MNQIYSRVMQIYIVSLLAFTAKYGVSTNQWTWLCQALLEVSMTTIALWICVCADDWAAELAVKASNGPFPIAHLPIFINRLMELTLDSVHIRKQDSFLVFTYVSETPIGNYIVWDILRSNFQKIYEA